MGYAALGLATVLALATGSAVAEEKPREGVQADKPRAEADATAGAATTEATGDATTEATGEATTKGAGDAAPVSGETLPENTVDAEAGRNEDQDGDEIRVEESAILPNAEGHLESEAETMDLDCENNPEDCVDAIEDPTSGPALSDDADPATVQDDEDPVVARP